MKKCNKCLEEKSGTEFYRDFNSKTGRLEAVCKECRLTQAQKRHKNKPKIIFEPKNTGKKKCGDCKIIKPIKAFGINRALKDGRNRLCRICHANKGRKYTRKRAPIYLAIGRVAEPQNDKEIYIKEYCEVCEIEFTPMRRKHKRCNECSLLVRNIQSNASTARGKGKYHIKCSTEDAVEIAKKFFQSKNCFYCKRNYTNSNKKSIDHILPICSGGGHNINNINICCLECNFSKRDLLLSNWINLCTLVANNFR